MDQNQPFDIRYDSQTQQKTQGESPPFAILAIIYSYQVSYGKALKVAAVGASNGKPRLFK